MEEDGLLRYHDRIYIPNKTELWRMILEESHLAPYSGQPGVSKMLSDIKPLYFRKEMKWEITEFVAGCLECQEVKAEHRYPVGLLHPNEVPEWKWQIISMDFVQGLPMTRNRNNIILVVIDRLTKVAHFIPGNLTYGALEIAHEFIKEIFRLHGAPKKIISDRDARITSRFWQTLFSALGTKLNICSAYHPEIDGQTKKVN